LTSLSLQHALHPSILTTYWLGILSIRNDTPYPNVLHDLPLQLRTTAQHQERLGWSQLFYGRLTHHWAQAIDHLNPHLAPTGVQIITKLTQAMWTYILAVWALRNQHLHQDAGHLSLPNYQQAVRTLYERKAQLPPAAQEALFRRPLQEKLELPPTTLSVWIVRAHTYMTQQSKAAQTRARINNHDIRSFFPVQSANDLHPP